MVCACGSEWVVEACDLRTGRVRAILHPVAFDFQTVLNAVGQGSLSLATREVSVRDIWPHLTSVYISRIAGGDASPTNPVPEFAGLIESFSASDSGSTMVGLKSIEQYLWHRNVGMGGGPSLDFTQESQNAIGAALVTYAQPDGIPLTGIAAPSAFARDRNYPDFERKNIGEAMQELTQVINGGDWELVHTRTNGSWSTQIIFRDYVGTDQGTVVQSDREAAGYGLDVDAQNHATFVDALGAGEERDQLTAHAEDTSGVYPRFDAAPAWQDVSIPATLQSHADGYVDENREPIAIPSATVRGMGDPDPALIRNGDTVRARINYGAVTYDGLARIISTSWSVTADGPASRTYEMAPITRASESVLSQEPTDPCPDC